MSNASLLGPDFKTPLEMFYQWEAQMPDQSWFRQETGGAWRDISWAEAGILARRLAAAIQAMGLHKGDKVGIYAANSPEWILTDLACMMAGMVTVPIYTTMPMDKVKYVAQHSDMRAVFVGPGISIAPLRSELPGAVLIAGLPGVDSADADQHWEDMISKKSTIGW